MNSEERLMNNRNYRKLQEDRNRFIKQMNFAEARLEKYSYALSPEEKTLLGNRIASIREKLLDVNDKIAEFDDTDATEGFKGLVDSGIAKRAKQA